MATTLKTKALRKAHNNYEYLIPADIAGIPCLLATDTVSETRGSYSRSAETDVEYYGAIQVEFVVLDRKGYKAAWLEKKITPKIMQELYSTAADHAAWHNGF